jgi:deoxycytidine triphosphate deaminase
VPFAAANLHPTFYYFRLGPKYSRFDSKSGKWTDGTLTDEDPQISVEPYEYLLVESLERFRCSEQVLALFSQSSSLVRKGLSLRHSAFIDPNFPAKQRTGFLEIGLKNEIDAVVDLGLGEDVGKVCFFNVADTYPIGEPKGATGKTFQRRASTDRPKPRPAYDDHPVPGLEDS